MNTQPQEYNWTMKVKREQIEAKLKTRKQKQLLVKRELDRVEQEIRELERELSFWS